MYLAQSHVLKNPKGKSSRNSVVDQTIDIFKCIVSFVCGAYVVDALRKTWDLLLLLI